MGSIRRIALKYDGSAKFDHENNCFCAHIALNFVYNYHIKAFFTRLFDFFRLSGIKMRRSGYKQYRT